MNIYFRTNFNNNIGIGHLVRCSRLANELDNRGHKCFFYLDTFKRNKLLKFNSYFLYKKKNIFKESIDSKKFINETNKLGPGYVIVDDYRIGIKWERHVSKFHKKVITFDDINKKKHYSDLIINYNPINYPLVKYNYSLNIKKKSNFLIHPKYSILSRKKISKNYTFEKNKFYITFYLGGGGDLLFLKKILNNLAKNKNFNKKIRFLVIIGNLAKNKKMIFDMAKKFNSIAYFHNKNDLYYVLKKTKILLATSGTAIFESAYLKTPTILFETSLNQKTNIFSLENIGHYMYLNKSDFRFTDKIICLISAIVNNYSRFKLLNKDPLVNIDNKGSLRIAKEIFS